MIGRVIDGDYRVDGVIGSGSFGAVYRCTELQLQRPVALKMLRRDRIDPQELERFLAEGRKLALLNHPNVVQIYRLGHDENVPYFVMEYVQGVGLRELLLVDRIPYLRGLEIMRDVAAGMRAIHAKNIVHRDLSTNNILVTATGETKVVDLGLSRVIEDPQRTATAATLAGTIPYLSPEQIESRGVSYASDVFSFGIILYEVLGGRNPFEADHYMATLYNIVHRAAAPLESHLPNCPEEIAALVARCLEKRPEDRPGGFEEIERLLVARLEDSGYDPRAVAPDVPLGAVRTTARNPYLSRVMIKRPQDFYGRTQERRRIFARLSASPPGSISIVGDRKIGKSSLLNYIYTTRGEGSELRDAQRMIMVFIDLQEAKGLPLKAFIQAFQRMVGYELGDRLDLSDCTHDLHGIKEMVQRIDHEGYRLAILLDEFETITTNPNFDLEFFSFLRFLANHYNVAYLTSSARDLQILCHTQEISDSPFFNIFSSMRLSVFRPEEAEELIRGPAERLGIPLAPYTAEILELAGLFPFFIQIACTHAVEYMHETPGTDRPDFAEIRARFAEEAKPHFRYLWEGFEPHERETLAKVARRKPVPPALGDVLQELRRRNYLHDGPARPQLFSSTFADFVRAETGVRETGRLRRLFSRA